MQNTYSSRDFYLSAYLITSGMRLSSTSKSKTFTEFNFEDNSELKRLVDLYYAMQAKVEPMAYGNAIRALKSVIHTAANSNSNGMLNNESKLQR